MKIQLHGQFETSNYGDLLLCILFYDELKAAGHEIIVKNACDELYDYLGDEVLKEGTPDKIVCCGGGYLCDGDFRFSLHMIKRIYMTMAKARLLKIPYAIIGAGTKPYKNRWMIPFFRWCLNGADFISVRNEESKIDLENIGVKNTINVTADNVVRIDGSFIKAPVSKDLETILSTLDPKKKNVLLHINYLPIDGNEKINVGGETLINAVTTYANSHDEFNYIITFDHDIDLFLKQCEKLKKGIKATNVVICPGNTVYDVMNIINNSDIIITTKLHVGITGVALYKNIISFPMHIKTERFYKQLAAETHCKLLQECVSEEVVLEFLDNNMNSEIKKEEIDKLKEKSITNYKTLVEYCS